jgi:catechol 2,3-dioxygenase-like lactoylglutathione lyase family enzyme
MILGVHHTAIATHDIERLYEFYSSLFGMTKLVDDGWSDAEALDQIVGLPNSAARFMLLNAGNQCLELFQFSSPEPGEGSPNRPVCDPGFTHICFAVKNIDAEYERLSNAGMRFHAPPMIAGDRPLRATYGRDPDGNVIELLEIVGEIPFDYAPTTPRWRD